MSKELALILGRLGGTSDQQLSPKIHLQIQMLEPW